MRTVVIDGVEYEPKKQPATKVKVGDWVQDSDGDRGVVVLVDPDGDGWHVVENELGWLPLGRPPLPWSLDPNKRYRWVTGDIVEHRPATPTPLLAPQEAPTPALKYKVGQYVRFDCDDLKSEGRIMGLRDEDLFAQYVYVVEVTGSNRQEAWEPDSDDIELYGCEKGKRYWYVSEESITAAQDAPFIPPAPAPDVGQVWRRKEGSFSDDFYILTAFDDSYFLFNTSTGWKWSHGKPTAMGVFAGRLGDWEYVGEAADLIAKGLGK